MSTIHAPRGQCQSPEAYADVADVLYGQEETPFSERREIHDATAVTIAAWWQSTGVVGRHMATLASGLPVHLDSLLDDIACSRDETDMPRDRDALDCLATWAMNHPSRH